MGIKNKSVIVTGGAGFIGSNLVEELAEQNDVTVIDNMHTGTRGNLLGALKTGRVRLLKRDVREILKLKLKHRPEIIFHLGMYSSSPMYKENNYRVSEVVEGAISIYRYAIKNNAKVVFASSSSIYSGHKPPHREEMVPRVTDFYTEARIAVERLAELYNRLYGLNAIGLRLSSVYGPHEENKKGYANLISQFLWAAMKGRSPVVYGNGTQRRDFVYVDDVVDAFVRASRLNGFEIINVGTGRSHSINEMIRRLGKHLGRKLKPRYIKQPIKNYVMYTQADTRKAERMLGFRARHNLDSGIKKLLDYYDLQK